MMDELPESSVCDDKAFGKAKQSISEDFDFFFYYLGSLDESGHAFKFCSDEYINRLSDLNDNLLGIFDHLNKEGILKDTYIIFNTDHGASYMTNHHGDQNDDNLNVPWMIMGPNIKKNYEIQSNIKNMDTVATITKILGINPNKIWRSASVDEVFILDPVKQESKKKEKKEKNFLVDLE
jgi:arylsulfatase A-like enzyme